jgi:WD40 repeat protein
MGIAVVLPLLLSSVLQAPPSTEVFLASLSADGDRLVIGDPVNVSNNAGYDNQPSFTPDGRAILFTSVRGGRKPDPANSAATGSDIYRFEIDSKRLTRVTDTPEAEYSPTVTPDGRHISVIRVEADGTQRLWRLSTDGRDASLVLADVKPVGYHAWADASTLALFVLGRGQGAPATLQLADVRTGKAETLATDIGRSLARTPDGRISFVQRETSEGGPATLTVCELDPATRRIRTLVKVVPGAAQADLAWTPDGRLLLAHGGKLYTWRAGQTGMSVAADLDSLGLRDVSRMAVSPDGRSIAIVAGG